MLNSMRLELAGRRPFIRPRGLAYWGTPDGHFHIDARRLSFASPLDLAGVVSMAHVSASKGMDVSFEMPDRVDVASYVQRMDVLERLPETTKIIGSVPLDVRFAKKRILLEVSAVTEVNADEVGGAVAQIAAAFLGQELGRKVFGGVGELIENAVSHGDSELGTFVAAQGYTGATSEGRRLEVAVCDAGVGILEHLRRNPDHDDVSSTLGALKRCLKRGATGTTDPEGGRGNGLADLARVPKQPGIARFVLRTGDGLASVSFGRSIERPFYAPASTAIQGTWAWLRVAYQ
ncbi:hypothetical protein [Streptosporangium subroseum]|uniref:hypothetical protein n=1 Tax=Streptosporangium subroseum TaxID=106412 RepID=UPI003091B3D0|nr:hypothetical protein OHB15_09485 [Streptosporangium subroseum]